MTQSGKVIGMTAIFAILCGACDVVTVLNPLNVFAFIVGCLFFLAMVMGLCTYHVIHFFERLYADQD